MAIAGGSIPEQVPSAGIGGGVPRSESVFSKARKTMSHLDFIIIYRYSLQSWDKNLIWKSLLNELRYSRTS